MFMLVVTPLISHDLHEALLHTVMRYENSICLTLYYTAILTVQLLNNLNLQI